MVKDKLGAAAASAPKRVPTGKYTLNGWGQTEADFAFFDLAQDKVELKSDGWRTKKIADDPNVYEWWYFDIHNHDGTVITGMLSAQSAIGRVPRFGTPRAMSRIDVNRQNVQRNAIETFPIDQFASATASCDVRSGGLTMRGDFTELQITGKVKDHEINVVFRQTATPLRPGSGYVFLGSTDTFQGWFNAFPSATATGHVIIGGETIEIDGVGYHDHNYGNVPISEGYRGWFWARPSFKRYTTLALEVQNGERFGGGSAPVLWVYDKETKKELVRATTLDDMTITFGSMVQFPDPLHGGAYPSVTVYDYRHDEDRVRLQLNDIGVLFTFLPYDTRDPQIQKYLTSIGSNGVYYTRRSSNVELALNLPSLKVKDAAFGTALHEFSESYFPQYLAYR
jgi:hypothetical protein